MSTEKVDIDSIIGDPRGLESDLLAFERDSRVLSTRRATLIAKYPRRWVAIFGGQVQADARTLSQLLAKVDSLGLPRQRAVIRYIDRNPRKLIL
ncbi:MAG: hypothetical protein LC772_02650 [Chloroflexi bacterium]|nr:hypothetical protein [Chloroflexota bacterium]